MPQYNITFDWNRISTLGKVKVLVEQVVGQPSDAQITSAVEDWLDEHVSPTTPIVDDSLTISGAAADSKTVGDSLASLSQRIDEGTGLTSAQINALLDAFNHVAWDSDDPTGQTYITALASAFRSITSITAVFNQGDNIIPVNASLDSLEQYLTVTASYRDGTSEEVTDYTLSGTLTVGESTITVSYSGFTTTFTCTVDALLYSWDFTQGLTDEIGGRLAYLSAGSGHSAPTQTANGITFSEATQRIYFGGADYNLAGKTIEYDVASCQFAGNSSYHIRHIVISNNNQSTGYGMSPLVFRSGTGWSSYGYSQSSTTTTTRAWVSTPWISGTTSDVVDVMSGKTVKIVIGSDRHTVKLYIDDTLIGTQTTNYFDSRCKYLMFGGQVSYDQTKGDQCYDLVLTGFRIYEGEV